MAISITISFDMEGGLPQAEIDDGLISAWLEEWGNEIRNFFISNMGSSPSPPGAYPGIKTGQLAGSIDVAAGGRDCVITASTSYAGFLVSGTSKMAPRKMLKEAVEESPEPDTSGLADAVRWV